MIRVGAAKAKRNSGASDAVELATADAKANYEADADDAGSKRHYPQDGSVDIARAFLDTDGCAGRPQTQPQSETKAHAQVRLQDTAAHQLLPTGNDQHRPLTHVADIT